MKTLVGSWPNFKIKSTKFNSKNEDETLELLTKELLEEAKSDASRLAKMMGKKVGEPTNIKIINMQTEGSPHGIMLYVLEQKAYMEIEVTFGTL